jgi:hypothetical protein
MWDHGDDAPSFDALDFEAFDAAISARGRTSSVEPPRLELSIEFAIAGTMFALGCTAARNFGSVVLVPRSVGIFPPFYWREEQDFSMCRNTAS